MKYILLTLLAITTLAAYAVFQTPSKTLEPPPEIITTNGACHSPETPTLTFDHNGKLILNP